MTQGRLFGLVVLGLHLFLLREQGLLMSGGHLLQLLELGWGIQQGQPFGGQFLAVGIVRGPGLGLGLCMRRSQVLYSQYIHSFNIIGGR